MKYRKIEIAVGILVTWSLSCRSTRESSSHFSSCCTGISNNRVCSITSGKSIISIGSIGAQGKAL
jgi:hypothetical protein